MGNSCVNAHIMCRCQLYSILIKFAWFL